MAVTLESGLDADVSDLDFIFDTDLSTDAKKYWLNVGYSFLNDLLDWSEFSDGKKARMEALAAADAASCQDPRVYQESVGDAKFRYQRDRSETDYWRMLVGMDHTGKVANAKTSNGAEFEAFGPGWDS